MYTLVANIFAQAKNFVASAFAPRAAFALAA